MKRITEKNIKIERTQKNDYLTSAGTPEIVKLCLKAPVEYYKCFEDLKEKSKSCRSLFLSNTNKLVSFGIRTIFDGQKKDNSQIIIKKIDEYSKRQLKEEKLKSIFLRIPMDDYITIEKIRLESRIRGIKLTLNTVLCYVIYTCYVKEESKLSFLKYINEKFIIKF